MAQLAPQGQEFFLPDGRQLKTVRDLYETLEHMSDGEFRHFVNKHKHDFATWIEHSLDDKFLAALARRARSRRMLRKILFMALFR